MITGDLQEETPKLSENFWFGMVVIVPISGKTVCQRVEHFLMK